MIEYHDTTRRNDRETQRVPRPGFATGLTLSAIQRPLDPHPSNDPRTTPTRNTTAARCSSSTRSMGTPCSSWSNQPARLLWTPDENDQFPPLTRFEDLDSALAEGITE